MTKQGKKNRQRHWQPMITAHCKASPTGRVTHGADDAQCPVTRDGLSAGAGTGISHRRKIP